MLATFQVSAACRAARTPPISLSIFHEKNQRDIHENLQVYANTHTNILKRTEIYKEIQTSARILLPFLGLGVQSAGELHSAGELDSAGEDAFRCVAFYSIA